MVAISFTFEGLLQVVYFTNFHKFHALFSMRLSQLG
jgi:hypothetical protein